MKIALTYTGTEEKHNNYVRWLEAGDAPGKIEVIRIAHEHNNLEKIYECDGLLLSGGIDVDPEIYGKTKDYANAPSKFNRKRDNFEIKAFAIALERQIPILGVCRGLQLINCVFEGNLKRDIGKKRNSMHRAEGVVDKCHGIRLVTGTKLQGILGSERWAVNSAHHQSVKKVGKGLKISAYAEDGTIEGLEQITIDYHPFIMAVQWHPERMYKFQLDQTAPSQALRDSFIEAIKKTTGL